MRPERREKRYVKIYMTPIELKEEGEKLAREIQKVEAAEANAKSEAKMRKEEIERMSDHVSGIAALIRRGYREEERDVLIVYDVANGIKQVTNPQTGELYVEEPMQPNEALPLPLDGVAEKVKKK